MTHLVRLLRIKRLRDIGVPLAQIAAVMQDTEEPDEAIRVLDAELEATIERLTRIRTELAVLMRHRAPLEVPPSFAPVPLSAAKRSLLMVYSTVFSERGMRELREIVSQGYDVDEEFDRLPADADDATIDRLAEQLVSVSHLLREAHPWLVDPLADSPLGAKLAENTLAHAVARSSTTPRNSKGCNA